VGLGPSDTWLIFLWFARTVLPSFSRAQCSDADDWVSGKGIWPVKSPSRLPTSDFWEPA